MQVIPDIIPDFRDLIVKAGRLDRRFAWFRAKRFDALVKELVGRYKKVIPNPDQVLRYRHTLRSGNVPESHEIQCFGIWENRESETYNVCVEIEDGKLHFYLGRQQPRNNILSCTYSEALRHIGRILENIKHGSRAYYGWELADTDVTATNS